MERLKQRPGIGPLINLIATWPRITAWIVLSLGCVILLVYEARDVGLTAGNWIALIVATVVVAGLCIWIVSWEEEDTTGTAVVPEKSEPVAPQKTDS